MIKKSVFFILVLFLFVFFLGNVSSTFANQLIPTPRPCSLGYGCPQDSDNTPFRNPDGAPASLPYIYSQNGEKCVTSYEEFLKDPINNHFWVDDEEITAQGKANERARQFIHWVLTHPSIDNHPSIFSIWSNVRNVAYFFTLILAAIFGLGLILNHRFNFYQKIEVWPQIFKLILVLLFITFSASIVLTLIQLSDVLMKFFVETLGGKDIFNIYFSSTFDEKNYQAIFCKDLNYKVQESIKTEIFLLKLTNITYYVLGIMIILRKIILWFLIFVSPFLALLLPFIFIRNIGWIWIGVFFQWLFYGPLLGLFLYALKVLWQNGIPFPFDFSRTGTVSGYVFPTGITILYGGPAQKLSVVNSVNYIDTYAEYIISLIMLWATIFFPWWLLRIFRDYCCEGIYATKNILMSIYDQLRNPPSPSSSPSPSPVFTSTSLKIPKEVEIPLRVKLETIEEIKKAKTEEISKSLNLHVSKLTDIAHIETNKQIYKQITQNLNYLKNPISAETSKERQRYINLKAELANRAVKQDQIAQRIVSTISTSKIEQIFQKQQLIRTLPKVSPATQIISSKTNLSVPQLQSIINKFSNNNQLHQTLSQKTNIAQETIQKILTSFSKNINQHPLAIVQKVSEETNVPVTQVKTILTVFKDTLMEKPELVDKVLDKEIVTKEKIRELIDRPLVFDEKIKSEQLRPISLTPKIQYILNNLSVNTFLHQTLSQKTNIAQETIQKILTSFSKNINQHPLAIVQKVSEETNVPVTQVKTILNTFKETIKENSEVVEKLIEKEVITPQKIKTILQQPIFVEPEKVPEQMVSIPSNVSLEEYEEVKKMWMHQYEKGEVPISENVKNREQWIDQDIIFITNTLNKLLSPNEELKQQGLEDVGYILPIFLINNLTGEQLITYLRAKLEAAKLVKMLINKAKEITQKLKEKSNEELVEVEVKKKDEKPKAMEMEESLKIEEKDSQGLDNQEGTNKS